MDEFANLGSGRWKGRHVDAEIKTRECGERNSYTYCMLLSKLKSK